MSVVVRMRPSLSVDLPLAFSQDITRGIAKCIHPHRLCLHFGSRGGQSEQFTRSAQYDLSQDVFVLKSVVDELCAFGLVECRLSP